MKSTDAPVSQTLRLVYILGLQDLKHSYRRSAVGPFWITIGMAIQTFSMGAVFSIIFKIKLEDYLPFLALNTVIWSFIAATVNESGNSILQAEGMVKQIKLPSYLHSMRVVWKNMLIAGHNILFLPLVFIIFWHHPVSPLILLALPGLILLVANLSWISYVLSFACLRFRDLSPMVSSALNVLYFVTPIMWKPDLLGNDILSHFLLGINPLYHLFQVVRLPILGEAPTFENWVATTLMATVGLFAAKFVKDRFAKEMVFWL